MTPTVGPVGSMATINVTSTSFPIEGDYQVRWSSSASFDDEDNVVILATGNNPRMSYSLSVSFIIPEAKYGLNYVQLIRYGADDVLNFQFSVKPVLTVEPADVNPGATVILRGAGFPEKDEGSVLFDGVSPGIPFTTNELGSFSTSYTLPETIAGVHKFVANSKKLYADSAAADLAVQPFVALSPENPEIGADVTISGGGFAANSQLTITYDGKAVSSPPKTTDKGSFSYNFKVTESDKKDHKIEVQDKAGNTANFGMPLENVAPDKPGILSPKEKDQTFGFMGAEPITFTWAAVEDASGVSYILEVGENLDFFPLKPGMRKTGLTDTSVTMEIPPGTYFWRVKAVDGAGNEGEWSVSPNFFKVGFISMWLLIGGGVVILVVFIVLIRAFFKRLKDYYG